jgi:hypothetical protein
MLPREPHKRSLGFYKLTFKEKLDGKNNQAQNEHENTDAVNAMHVFDEPCFRPARIRLFEVEIFRYLL